MVTRPEVKYNKQHGSIFAFTAVAIIIIITTTTPNNLVNLLHLTNWASEFILLTDLHLFACMVYIGYPTA